MFLPKLCTECKARGSMLCSKPLRKSNSSCAWARKKKSTKFREKDESSDEEYQNDDDNDDYCSFSIALHLFVRHRN